MCLGLKKKCFYLPLLPEFVDCVSHDWEGSRLSKCHCLGKMSILIFFQHKIVELCLWQLKKY